jgi:hypothetical protein
MNYFNNFCSSLGSGFVNEPDLGFKYGTGCVSGKIILDPFPVRPKISI